MMLELPYTSMFEGHDEYKWSCFRDYPAERMYELKLLPDIRQMIKNTAAFLVVIFNLNYFFCCFTVLKRCHAVFVFKQLYKVSRGIKS